jgi:hypothetical protein
MLGGEELSILFSSMATMLSHHWLSSSSEVSAAPISSILMASVSYFPGGALSTYVTKNDDYQFSSKMQ